MYVTPRDLEEMLSGMFGKVATPVVVSSGRVGLVLALEALGVKRMDPVGLFGYASHCVIEAVGRVGSPVCYAATTAPHTRIVYHQWGYVQQYEPFSRLVEDAVDSFCLPGAILFPAGGDYEVWSLAKIFGCQGGGVLWCRDRTAASRVRALRDGRTQLKHLRWALRYLSAPFPRLRPLWYGAESAGGEPPAWACGDMRWCFDQWEEIGANRRRRLELVQDLAPAWLPSMKDRLPAVVPVLASEQQGAALVALGFHAGFRHFEVVAEGVAPTHHRTFPIPVHQDVPLRVLEHARRILME